MSFPFKMSSIINPFAPKKAKITIDVNLETMQADLKCDIGLPHSAMVKILLSTAGGVVDVLEKENAMIVNPNKNKNPGEKESG